jgi:benzoyl-CoA reductase/2-hydroxyglutaryl-CoA dehydratase subunit BcrC/BadD/HgdB
MNIDTILERLGLKYEELNFDEKATLSGWMEQLQGNKLTLEDVKKNVTSMKESVERELSVSNLDKRNDAFLKARLRNYLLLEAFMTSPEKAEQALQRQLAGLISKKS